MNQNFTIRPATIEDSLNLAVLKTQVWLHTYATEGIRTEFSKYLTSAFTEENMRQLLANPNIKVYVAEENNHLWGCAVIDFKSDCPDPVVKEPELTVLYVSEHFHGKGIGYSLLRTSEEEVYSRGHKGLWLTAYHENNNALQFYQRQQYRIIGSTFFEMEYSYENKILYKDL